MIPQDDTYSFCNGETESTELFPCGSPAYVCIRHQDATHKQIRDTSLDTEIEYNKSIRSEFSEAMPLPHLKYTHKHACFSLNLGKILTVSIEHCRSPARRGIQANVLGITGDPTFPIHIN